MHETETAPASANSPLAKGSGVVRRHILIVSIIATFTFAGCYLQNFAFPHVPILFWRDQMLYAANGLRFLSGQMPYRDYFEFLTPGTDWAYALLFRYFGVWLWIPNLLMDVLATASVLLMTLAAKRVLRRASIILPAIFALGFGLYGGLDATHHWFSTPIALAAMVVLLHGMESRHLILAGALCGLAASFTQSKGAAVTLGFVIYVIWWSMQRKDPARAWWRRCFLLCGSAFVCFLLINIHYMLKLGIAEWFRWIVVFSLRYYPTVPGQNLHSPVEDFHDHAGSLKWICAPFLYLAVPAIYISFLWIMRRTRRREPDQPWEQLLLIAITGISMFVAITPSLSILRASAVSFPATILLAWHFERVTGGLRWMKGAFVALSLACVLRMMIATQETHWNYLDLPAGRTAIQEQGRYELYRWMQEHTHPGQTYFGINPMPVPLRLSCPAPIQAPGPWKYYRPEHIARAITAIEANHIPLLVLRPPDARFRNVAGYDPEIIRPLQEYVGRHYRKVATFSTGDEVWERIAGQPAADH